MSYRVVIKEFNTEMSAEVHSLTLSVLGHNIPCYWVHSQGAAMQISKPTYEKLKELMPAQQVVGK